MAGILAVALALALIHYDSAAAPPPDFFSFRNVAVSFARLEAPSLFKRAPAFPAAMALGRLVAPGPHPYHAAANVISLGAALAVLALTYYWTRPRLGRWAPLAVFMVAAFSQFTLSAARPLCEMFYLVFILAAVATAGRGTGNPYVWAGLAAATRYEAAALIPLIALCDLPHWRRRPRLLLYAGLAVLPVGAWVIAGYFSTTSPQPYLDEIRALGTGGIAFPRELAAAFFEPTKPAWWAITGAFAAVTLAGFGRIAARGGPGERAYLGFAVIYTVIHIIFPFSFRRFVFPVWPILAVGFIEGGRLLSAAVSRFRLGRIRYGLAAVAVALFVYGNVHVFLLERAAMRHHRASLRAAAAWLARAAGPDDVVVTTDADLFRYYFGAAGPRARTPVSFKTDVFGRFAIRARRAGVAYVCYDSLTGRDPSAYFASRAGASLLGPLAEGRDVRPFYFVAAVETPGEYVYIYRLACEFRKWVPEVVAPPEGGGSGSRARGDRG